MPERLDTHWATIAQRTGEPPIVVGALDLLRPLLEERLIRSTLQPGKVPQALQVAPARTPLYSTNLFSLFDEEQTVPPFLVIEFSELPKLIAECYCRIWKYWVLQHSAFCTLDQVVRRNMEQELIPRYICPHLNLIGLQTQSIEMFERLRPLSVGKHQILHPELPMTLAFLLPLENFPGRPRLIRIIPPTSHRLQYLEELLWRKEIGDYDAYWVAERFSALQPTYEEFKVCAQRLNYKPGWAWYSWQSQQRTRQQPPEVKEA